MLALSACSSRGIQEGAKVRGGRCEDTGVCSSEEAVAD